VSGCERHFLVGFAFVTPAHVDSDLLLKGIQECKKPPFGEKMILTIHQFGYFRLIDAEQSGDFPLFELSGLQDQAHGVPQSRAREKFIGVAESEVGEHIATPISYAAGGWSSKTSPQPTPSGLIPWKPP
jgi:hypothetical protein